jgi:diketogulonate reductase-like aldo/keto reductase
MLRMTGEFKYALNSICQNPNFPQGYSCMQSLKLWNGESLPMLGLGTWQAEPSEVGQAVKYALLEAGYRHIDCASIYGNEREIGRALTESFGPNLKREEVFITSKLWNTHHRAEHVEAACRQTLRDLQLDYLDLYLVHWMLPFEFGGEAEPVGADGVAKLEHVSLQETWQAMERLVDLGLVKSIGVANCSVMMLIDLLTYARIQPAVNQIELHPYNAQTALVKFCQDHTIAVTAYSPLATPASAPEGFPKLLDDSTVQHMARKYSKTPAQIVLRWAIERDTAPIPKSTNLARIKENMEVLDFTLSSAEVEILTALDKRLRYVDPIDWWGIPYFC